LMMGFSLAVGENPAPIPWLAVIPVYLFGVGAFFAGRAIATRTEGDIAESGRPAEHGP
jgi:hypothetical protein